MRIVRFLWTIPMAVAIAAALTLAQSPAAKQLRLGTGAANNGNKQTAKPNFSGRWELDKAKSDFGSGPAPKDIIMQINQKGKVVVVTTTFVTPNGEFKKFEKLRTDGVATTNRIRGHKVTSTAHWQGDSLVTVTEDPGVWRLTETRTLAKNGKAMTTTVVSGSHEQGVVYVKK